MPSGITDTDSMFSVRERPWHGLGPVLERPPSSVVEALQLAGLGWEVDQVGLRTEHGDPVPGVLANVRLDTRQILGVVSTRYTVVQNVEALRFLDNLIGSSMHFETAGSLWGGRRVWALATLPEWIEVGGDRVDRYCLVTTGHDGAHGIKAAVTPIRVVCQNTLTWGLDAANRVYAVRHSGDMTGKLHEARRVLEITVDYYTQFKHFGDHLAGQRMTDARLRKVLNELYPTSEGPAPLGKAALAKAVEARDTITYLFKYAPTVGNAPGSKWAAANAFVEYLDHYRPSRGERFARIVDERGNPKAKALAVIIAA
jgi:phage/plasmid-like protein (TIGR03299 family)